MDILKRKKKNRKPSLTDPPTTYAPKPPLPARQHHQPQPPHQLQQSYPAYQQQHHHHQHSHPYQHQPHQYQQHQQHASPTLPPRPSQLTLYSPHETPLSSHFDSVMTQIDCESLSGDEDSLFSYTQNEDPLPRSLPFGNISSVMAGTYFSKVDQYSNSQLPHHHPVFTESFESWATICLAAQYSLRVYTPTTAHEETSRILSPWYHHSPSSTPKATCIKSISMDSARVIVFAIRGTASFSDWATNLQTAPASSADFLSDTDSSSTNYCHAGFLAAARSMIGPVAARIRALLQDDPGRASYSLLMTGHSAGGAIASLLYAHMVSGENGVESDLSTLAGWFRRVHCITFGAPPVSLLPLRKPSGKRWRKSLFLAFANQGDPVVRAEKAYVKSLLELLAAPAPRGLTTWDVPQSTLINAGDVVVLRPRNPKPSSDKKTVQERLDEGVQAVTCGQEDLRPLVWGDPVCHLMKLYKDRIDLLAVHAVTAER